MTDFDNISTTRNRNEYSTKREQTVLLQLDYVSTLRGKTKNDTKQPTAYAVHSVELIVPDVWRKSFNVRFFPYLLVHFFSSLPTKNILHSHWFYEKKLSLNSIRLILTCKLKLNGREMRRVTVMTSSS